MNPQPYTSLHEFRLRYPIRVAPETLLGSGAYGKVVKVEDQVETEWVAIKISEFKGNDARSLRAEVELARNLPRQANIARYDACYRLETDTGISDFALMKYYPDGNLAEFMQANTLNETQIDELVRGILRGLEHLHRHRIVHRDFKPANILISRDNRGRIIPKIADFGLSKLVRDDEIDSSDFDLSDGRGTPSYKAPEQIEGGRVSFNLDLWAFGVILYELLTGEKPFSSGLRSGSEQSVKRAIESKIVAAQLPDRIQTISEPYQTVIRRCLHKDIRVRARKETELFDWLDGIPPLLAEAETLMANGKYTEAIAHYELILTKREGNTVAKQGIDACQQAIELARRADLSQQANAQLEAEQWEQASETYQQLLALDPDYPGAEISFKKAQESLARQQTISRLLAEGDTYFNQQNFELAQSTYGEVLTLDPTLAHAKSQLPRCEEGISKQKIDRLFTQADALAGRKKVVEAKAIYQQILVLDPANQFARQHIQAGDEALNQQRLTGLIQKADSLFTRKRYADAQAIYERILAEEDGNHHAQHQLAAISEAIRQKRIRQWLTEADTLFGKKNYTDAKQGYERVLVESPNNSLAQQGLARCVALLSPPIDEPTDLLPVVEEPQPSLPIGENATDLFVPLPKPVNEPTPLKSSVSTKTQAVRPIGQPVWYLVALLTLAGVGYAVWPDQQTYKPEPINRLNERVALSKPTTKKTPPLPVQPTETIKPTVDRREEAYQTAINHARLERKRSNWASVTDYASEALRQRPNDQEANRLLKQAQAEIQQQRSLQQESEQAKLALAQSEYNNLIDNGMSMIAGSNNKAAAAEHFTKAHQLASRFGLSTNKANAAYSLCMAKGNRLMQLDELAGAKAWYELAQSVMNTTEVRKKINECTTPQ